MTAPRDELGVQIAEAFGLGEPQGPLVLAAEGWGGHNQVFRLPTTTGSWAVKRHERATFAVQWASRVGGGYDENAVVAFLRGYLDGGGVLERDDPAVLSATQVALLPWVTENVELALARPSRRQNALAAELVEALITVPDRVTLRQELLTRCLNKL